MLNLQKMIVQKKYIHIGCKNALKIAKGITNQLAFLRYFER